MQGLFTSNSNILSDGVLVSQWVIFILLLVDWYIARKRDIINHKRLVISLFVLQTAFNLFMLIRFFSIDLDIIIIFHGLAGLFAYLLIAYTILYMTEKLPEKLRFVPKKRRTLLMKITTIFWLFFTISGTSVYFLIYL
jgi:uncharacterized membrane protein YozB (DUF420 family)